jgi:hypothetical protein
VPDGLCEELRKLGLVTLVTIKYHHKLLHIFHALSVPVYLGVFFRVFPSIIRGMADYPLLP